MTVITAGQFTSPPYNCPTDGEADCRPAVLTLREAMQGEDVDLTLPEGIRLEFDGPQNCPNIGFIDVEYSKAFLFAGIKTLLVRMNGACLSNTRHQLGGFQLGCLGYPDAILNGVQTYSKVHSAKAGDKSVTKLNPADGAPFAVGDWCSLICCDAQGGFSTNPGNSQIFEYLQVADNANGVITFTTPLQYSFLETLPTYSQGGDVNANMGGNATLQNLTMGRFGLVGWGDTNFTFDGGHIDGWAETPSGAQIYTYGRVVKYQNMLGFNDSAVGSGGCVEGLVPSFNETIQFKDFSFPRSYTELDKLVDTVVYDNVQVYQVETQSSSVNNFYFINNSDASNALGLGGSKNYFTDGASTGTLIIGAAGYGRSLELTATDGTVRRGYVSGGPLDDGDISRSGVNVDYTMSDGIVRIPASMVPRWPVMPGESCFWQTSTYETAGHFNVLDVTQDPATSDTLVHTDWPGGFPVFPGSSALGIKVHPMPRCTFTNLVDGSGNPLFFQHPAGAPLNSYWHSGVLTKDTIGSAGNLSYTGSLWGKLVRLTINVLVASDVPLVMHFPSPFENFPVLKSDNSGGTFNMNIDLAQTGIRVVEMTGNTGAVGNDELPDLSSFHGYMWLPQQTGIGTPADISGTSNPLQVSFEFELDQGIFHANEPSRPPLSPDGGWTLHKAPPPGGGWGYHPDYGWGYFPAQPQSKK